MNSIKDNVLTGKYSLYEWMMSYCSLSLFSNSPKPSSSSSVTGFLEEGQRCRLFRSWECLGSGCLPETIS